MAAILAPYAILPSINEPDNDVHRSIFNVFGNSCYERRNMFQDNVGAWCVGSSHDWLILLDTEGCPFLLNPASSISIDLPPFSDSMMPHARVNHSYYVESLLKSFVFKAVLVGSPSPLEYTLVIMYSYPCKLAFCTNKSSTWVEFSDSEHYYSDIVSYINYLFALTKDGSIQGWNFNGQIPSKVFKSKPDGDNIDEEEEEREFPREKFSSQTYLVISAREFLLVKRFVGNFVNADGQVVYEGYDDDGGEICPYQTKCFFVYTLDFQENKWVKKGCLGDRALFVGANESTIVAARAGCEANSIYFTDDRWEEMSLDYSYGGHDWGVFSLQDRSVRLLAPRTNKMDPPPVWMVPTPLRLS
ncbi:uncharacterized protein LOC130744940 [Lotus japonicus]|uniref:uncharacterized protein LOC130744940 n=1 Tax=Lotus japonicus TaxID=34305 RepID=UPI00258B037A|nr:uncharacterized protein LOC130744940 [Lotus japonicus]